MTIQRIQLVGPCTGVKDFNSPLFNEAAGMLRAHGFQVVNPAELFRALCIDGTEPTWHQMMRLCIESILHADSVVRFHNWDHSKGASLEVRIAQDLGINVIDWAQFKQHLISQIRPYEDGLPFVNVS